MKIADQILEAVQFIKKKYSAVPGLNSLEQITLDPQVIQLPGKLARGEPAWIVMSFKIIQFLQDDRWDDNDVLFKGFKAVG